MDIEYPVGMRVGYELEFCTNAGIPESILTPLQDWFVIGRDTSLRPSNPFAHMHEIKSLYPLNVVSIDVIKLMLDQLKMANPVVPNLQRRLGDMFTTRNCGMHVHVSWEDRRMAHVFYGHLAGVLTQRIKPFEERRDYCSPTFDSRRGARYNALRWVQVEDGHFEVRIFNGTMKLRGIVNSLKMIRNEALLVARASQAAIRTQSANPNGVLDPAIGG